MSDLCCACGKDITQKNPDCVWCLFYDSLQPDYSANASAQQRPRAAPGAQDKGCSARLQAGKTSAPDAQ